MGLEPSLSLLLTCGTVYLTTTNLLLVWVFLFQY